MLRMCSEVISTSGGARDSRNGQRLQLKMTRLRARPSRSFSSPSDRRESFVSGSAFLENRPPKSTNSCS